MNSDILFRENTFATCLVESFLRIEGLEFLHHCLKEIVLKIYSRHQERSCEIDPFKIGKILFIIIYYYLFSHFI